MKLTARQWEVLQSSARVGTLRAWFMPMDIGGRDQSHHARTLVQLAQKGLVERKLRGSLLNQIRGDEYYAALAKRKRSRQAARGSYRYRITKAGKVVLARWRT